MDGTRQPKWRREQLQAGKSDLAVKHGKTTYFDAPIFRLYSHFQARWVNGTPPIRDEVSWFHSCEVIPSWMARDSQSGGESNCTPIQE